MMSSPLVLLPLRGLALRDLDHLLLVVFLGDELLCLLHQIPLHPNQQPRQQQHQQHQKRRRPVLQSLAHDLRQNPKSLALALYARLTEMHRL